MIDVVGNKESLIAMLKSLDIPKKDRLRLTLTYPDEVDDLE